jgi:hypothetical protein
LQAVLARGSANGAFCALDFFDGIELRQHLFGAGVVWQLL